VRTTVALPTEIANRTPTPAAINICLGLPLYMGRSVRMSQARLIARFIAPKMALPDQSRPSTETRLSAPLSLTTASMLSLTSCSEPGRYPAVSVVNLAWISSDSRK